MNDLGLDSLDQVEIIMMMEDEFGKISIFLFCCPSDRISGLWSKMLSSAGLCP